MKSVLRTTEQKYACCYYSGSSVPSLGPGVLNLGTFKILEPYLEQTEQATVNIMTSSHHNTHEL
jgi:hypothetical protein